MAKKRRQEKPKEYTRRQLSHFKKQKRRQRIIFIAGMVIIAVVILLPLAGWVSSDYYPLHKTMLVVNGKKFTVANYIDVMKVMGTTQSSTDVSTLANNAYQTMMQNEVVRQGAARLGITVSNDEIKNYLKNLNLPQSKSYMNFFESQLLVQKLQASYFGSKVPQTGNQTHPLIMMLESDQQAAEIRQRLVNGDNFTALAKEFGQDYYSKNINQGDYGMHVRDVLKDELSSAIPLDYAFNSPVGSLSPPLSDNETSKQLGYWLIKIADRPEEGKVNVQALLVSDNATALNVKARLEAGTASLADMADQYTQYSLSKEKHGDLGVISESENATYTKAFNDYVFYSEATVGRWSPPIRETELWTKGASWLVKVLERADDAAVSDEDKNTLISKALNDWYSQLTSAPDFKVNSELLTPEIEQWAINRLLKEVPALQGQTS